MNKKLSGQDIWFFLDMLNIRKLEELYNVFEPYVLNTYLKESNKKHNFAVW